MIAPNLSIHSHTHSAFNSTCREDSEGSYVSFGSDGSGSESDAASEIDGMAAELENDIAR